MVLAIWYTTFRACKSGCGAGIEFSGISLKPKPFTATVGQVQSMLVCRGDPGRIGPMARSGLLQSFLGCGCARGHGDAGRPTAMMTRNWTTIHAPRYEHE